MSLTISFPETAVTRAADGNASATSVAVETINVFIFNADGMAATGNNSVNKNMFTAGADNTWTLTDAHTDGEVNTMIKMPSLSHESHPQLTFRNATAGKTLFAACLPETIVAAYAAQGRTVDFSHTFTFDIVPTFDAALGVTVSVNGW